MVLENEGMGEIKRIGKNMKEETKKWLMKAGEDLGTAEDCMKSKRFSASAFYSQQASEKALKALQIQKFDKFDKVHDLLVLADSVKAPGQITNHCIKLTPYYTITRYPDVEEPISEDVARDLLDISKKVVEWVKQTLK